MLLRLLGTPSRNPVRCTSPLAKRNGHCTVNDTMEYEFHDFKICLVLVLPCTGNRAVRLQLADSWMLQSFVTELSPHLSGNSTAVGTTTFTWFTQGSPVSALPCATICPKPLNPKPYQLILRTPSGKVCSVSEGNSRKLTISLADHPFSNAH